MRPVLEAFLDVNPPGHGITRVMSNQAAAAVSTGKSDVLVTPLAVDVTVNLSYRGRKFRILSCLYVRETIEWE